MKNYLFPNVDFRNIEFMKLDDTIHLSFGQYCSPFMESSDNLNPNYFNLVYDHSISIFEDLFAKSSRIQLIHVVSEWDIGFKQTRFSHRFLNKRLVPQYDTYHNLYNPEITRHAFIYECTREDIKYKKLLKAINNQDFPSLQPSINQNNANFSELYFLNRDNGVIFHIYDDRGVWISFDDKVTLDDVAQRYAHYSYDFDVKDENLMI